MADDLSPLSGLGFLHSNDVVDNDSSSGIRPFASRGPLVLNSVRPALLCRDLLEPDQRH